MYNMVNIAAKRRRLTRGKEHFVESHGLYLTIEVAWPVCFQARAIGVVLMVFFSEPS